MRHFIEHHFGLVLLLSCVGGLILPGLPDLPGVSAMVALACLTFFSCFNLRDSRFSDIHWPRIALFYILRYGILPVLLWAAAHVLLPEYAIGVFLIALLPSAVSSPAFTQLFGGTMAPAFALAIVSQLLVPFLIPLQFSWLGDMHIAPNPIDLFHTLLWCVCTPIVAYAILRRSSAITTFSYRNSKLMSIILVAFVIALVIAKQRALILSDVTALLTPFLATLSCYAVFGLFGWYLAPRAPRKERIAYTVCSGFNNAALGVSLALLHFPPHIILFVAVSEIAWALLPVALKSIFGTR